MPLSLSFSVCRNRGGTDDTGSDVVDGGYGLVLVSVGRSSKIVKLSGPTVCDQDLRSLLQLRPVVKLMGDDGYLSLFSGF